MNKRPHPRPRHLVVLVLTAVAALATASQALAAPNSALNGRCQRNVPSFSASSSTASVSRNYPSSPMIPLPTGPTGETTGLSAFADAATQTLRALAALGIDGTQGDNDCTLNTSISDTAVVQPGGGFNTGDIVRLVLTPGLHGSFHAGPSPLAPSSLTSIDADASITLTDATACPPDEGVCQSATFTGSLSESTDASAAGPFNPTGSLTKDTTWRWRLRSNAAADVADQGNDSVQLCAVWPCTFSTTDPSFDPFAAVIDTGSSSIEFEAEVGRRFSIRASLGLLLQAYGGLGVAWANLLDTLHFSLAPAPGYAGVSISYESAGSAADTTPPVVACGSPDGVWHSDNVSIACAAHDDGVDLANAGDASFSLSTSVPAGSETADAATDSRQVCDLAGNCAPAGPIGGNMVDRKAPSLSVPADIVVEATGIQSVVQVPAPSGSDGGSGLASITCNGGSGQYPLGTTTLSCTATDNVGNQASRSFTVTVRDTTPPTLSLPSNLTVNATSPAGAALSYTATATDIAEPTPRVSCSPPSGSAFAIGQTTVTCTATDASGNSASGTFTVKVKGAKDQLNDLIQKVVNYAPLPPTVKTRLIGRLQTLVASFDPTNPIHKQLVCGALSVFINAVRALSGNALPAAVAADWIADATRIRAVLGC